MRRDLPATSRRRIGRCGGIGAPNDKSGCRAYKVGRVSCGAGKFFEGFAAEWDAHQGPRIPSGLAVRIRGEGLLPEILSAARYAAEADFPRQRGIAGVRPSPGAA